MPSKKATQQLLDARRFTVILHVTCLLLISVTCHADYHKYQHEPTGFPPDDYSEECSIYLAPSTIPGAGLGMFSGKNYKENDFLTSGDLLVPLIDLQAHNGDIDIHDLVLQSYYWLTYSMPAFMQSEASHTLAFSPGAGAALNCFFPLINTQAWEEETLFGQEGLHRSNDPGVGAFSPYYNRTTYATRDIKGGEELFTDYGPAYFTTQEDVFGKIPLLDTIPQTDALLRAFVKMRDKILPLVAHHATNSDDNQQTFQKDWYNLITSLSATWPSRVLNGLPRTADDVDRLAQTSVTWRDYNQSVKTIDWLETHGRCMDNIYPARSLINQAGRGAFAKRKIPLGSLVAPAPLVHLDVRVLQMYPGQVVTDEDDDDDKEDADLHDHSTDFQADLSKPFRHYQLLLNYCFGRAGESSVLLCPYGMMTGLINHARGNKANAKIVWNEDFSPHFEWKEQPLQQWIYNDVTGLAFDFVATRDIEPGEEVVIDYGEQWQAAWDDHVQRWKPPGRADTYQSAVELNDDVSHVIRMSKEGLYQYVNVLCHEWYRHVQGHRVITSDEDDSTTTTINCQATSRRKTANGEIRYTAELYRHITGVDKCQQVLIGILFDLPRQAFVFEDLPYTRDLHQSWAFRHVMQIPDELMPDIWKDLKIQSG
ncbi:hypothetical protein MPSEU_000750000 [Mayamaea pseudoterrestris]|nr:hypothetical protein MPSEU_000750000 [Mayamaea pseudoterrestris]